MTKPTDAQIEAARNEYLNRCGHYKPPSDETFAAIISAAAEVKTSPTGETYIDTIEDDEIADEDFAGAAAAEVGDKP